MMLPQAKAHPGRERRFSAPDAMVPAGRRERRWSAPDLTQDLMYFSSFSAADGPKAADSGPQGTDHCPQAADHRLQATDHRLQAADHRLQAVDHASQAEEENDELTLGADAFERMPTDEAWPVYLELEIRNQLPNTPPLAPLPPPPQEDKRKCVDQADRGAGPTPAGQVQPPPLPPFAGESLAPDKQPSPPAPRAVGGHSKRTNLSCWPESGAANLPLDWCDTTTVMMRNLPNKFTQHMLLTDMNQMNFLGTFDFLYLPIDPATSANKGYAFINFLEPSVAWMFKEHYEGRKMSRSNSEKVVSVSPASLQGFDANFTHYANSRVNRGDPACRPLFLREPNAAQIPGPAGHGGVLGQNNTDQFSKMQVTQHGRHVAPPGPVPNEQIPAYTGSPQSRSGVAQVPRKPRKGHKDPQKFHTWSPQGQQAQQGQPVQQEQHARFCPSCGSQREAQFKFCPCCGFLL